jgi:hypothetical protein
MVGDVAWAVKGIAAPVEMRLRNISYVVYVCALDKTTFE